MREIQELAMTTNGTVYKKLYKKQLEKRGKIHCSLCQVHRGENDERKSYQVGIESNIVNWKPKNRYPNWKMVSKLPKQWMKKPIRYQSYNSRYISGCKIVW